MNHRNWIIFHFLAKETTLILHSTQNSLVNIEKHVIQLIIRKILGSFNSSFNGSAYTLGWNLPQIKIKKIGSQIKLINIKD